MTAKEARVLDDVLRLIQEDLAAVPSIVLDEDITALKFYQEHPDKFSSKDMARSFLERQVKAGRMAVVMKRHRSGGSLVCVYVPSTQATEA